MYATNTIYGLTYTKTPVWIVTAVITAYQQLQ